MNPKVAAKFIVEQETGLVVDEAGNQPHARAVIRYKMTPFVITEDGDINYLASNKMETIYQADNQYFKFLENQVRELHVERSHGIFASVSWALTGSRHKTRRRWVTGIQPTPVTVGSATSTTIPDASVTTTPPAQVNIVPVEPAPEALIPEPIAEVPMQQPGVDSQLRGSYITTTQTQSEGNVSLCSLHSVVHEYLKNHFNERLHNKVYDTFKELFGDISTDSIKEALPKVNVYKNIIVKYVEEINLKYGIELSFTQLESTKVSHWAETFQIATNCKDQSEPQQLPQPLHTSQTQQLSQPLQQEQPQQAQQ